MYEKAHEPFITVSKGGCGWFAVKMWWNPEGFTEPYNTGFGRYATADKAAEEAMDWAAAEQVEYRAA